MSIVQGLLMELQHEAANTKKMLERVPMDKADWKPHEKSMTLGRLATHVAELSGWTELILNTNELDWATFSYKPNFPTHTEELLARLDENVAKAQKALEAATEESIMQPWTMRRGDHVFFTLPKAAVIRNFSMNHLYHHRGQLSTYLRLLDVAVPGMFGPSADETM
jgi:uncharacterized damage-inducible protein DinB